MKKIVFTTVVLFTTICCSAQLNYINNDEFGKSVKFNDVSLRDIMIASGDLAKMRGYFGDSIKERPNTTAPFLAKNLSNNDISFGFEDETDSGTNYDLATIYILNSKVTVNVKGLSVKLGDDKSKFKDFLFNAKSNSYSFTDADTGSVGLSFKISKYGRVSEIRLICY